MDTKGSDNTSVTGLRRLSCQKHQTETISKPKSPFFFRADAQSVAKIETPLCRGHRGHRGRRCTVCACCWNNSSTLWFHTISGSQTSRSDAQRPSTQVQAEPRSSNVVYLSACMRLPLTRCTNNILSVCGIKVFFFISGTFFFPFN